jgi:DNA-3-methyladenine glycosylase I
MRNAGIVRNRLKIQSIIKNAKAYLRIEATGSSFSDYIWQFVDGKTVNNPWLTKENVPSSTEQSDSMAKDLKKQGCHLSAQQSVGLLNGHTTNCFCYESSKLEGKL